MRGALDRPAADWRALWRHWETWVGVLLCALCAAAGGYASMVYFQHSPLPLLLGGAAGGYLYSRLLRLVRRRYEPPSQGSGGPLANAVDLYFRDDERGRLVVPEGPGSRYGYRVHSPQQEGLLRAYLSMRLWTQTAILVLGALAAWFAMDLRHRWNALQSPGDGARLVAIGVLAYFALLLAPILLFGRVSRQIEARYLAAADRVAVVPLLTSVRARRAMLLLLALGLGLLLAAVLLLGHIAAQRPP